MAFPHYLTLVSEQLWPQLLGLNYLIEKHGGVKSIHLLHTNDEERSVVPAKRLESLVKLLQPHATVELHRVGTGAQDVYEAVKSIIEVCPAETWELNCTGGTKMMFAGLIPHLGRKNVSAFYREVSGDWFTVSEESLGGQKFTGSKFMRGLANSRLNLPVKDLVVAQGDYPEGAEWSSTIPEPCDALRAIQTGIAVDWDWKLLSKTVPALSGQSGFAFEVLFAALLRMLGVTNIEAQLLLRNLGKMMQEFDVVASTGRKLVLFDLKLTNTDDSAKIDQIARIAADRRSLGGLSAAAVAVRPSWPADQELKAVAQAYSVCLWTAVDMSNIIELLAKILDVNLESAGSDINEVNSMLKEAGKSGRRIFTTEKAPRATSAHKSFEKTVGRLDGNAYMADIRGLGRKPLFAIDCGAGIFVHGLCDCQKMGDRRCFEGIVGRLGTVAVHIRSLNKVTFMAICLVPTENRKELLKILLNN